MARAKPAAELGVPVAGTDPIDLVHMAAGLEPAGYTGDLQAHLEPNMAANEAIAHTCRHLLATMRGNEGGVIADLDPEFLHAFRVDVRRMRSMLAASRRILPRPLRADLQQRCKWLGDVTTPVRDLDVFALAVPRFAESATRGNLALLQPLTDLVAADRKEAHAALVSALRSPAYAELLDAWRETLEALPTDADTTEARDPIAEVAPRRIWKAYRSLRRGGRAIDEDPPPEMLHQLRKDAKELRYLLEAFGALFDVDRTHEATIELKRLQDNLGAFQDAAVQIQALRGYAARIARRPTKVDTVMALGVVANHLEPAQDDARARFSKRFARFDAPGNRARYEGLFSPRATR